MLELGSSVLPDERLAARLVRAAAPDQTVRHVPEEFEAQLGVQRNFVQCDGEPVVVLAVVVENLDLKAGSERTETRGQPIGWGLRDELRPGYDPEEQRRHPLLANYVREARGVFGVCLCLGGGIIGFTIGRLADLPNAAGPAFLGGLIGVGLTIWLDNRFDQSL